MTEAFNSTQPIYWQLVQRICRQIIRRDLQPGEKLPSVRELAVQAGVNPNTVQRAYAELERMAVVTTKRGLGTFVTEDQNKLKQMRAELKQELIVSFINDMQELGFSLPEIYQGLAEELNKREKDF